MAAACRRAVVPRHRVISRGRRRPGVAPRPPRGITPRDIAPLARGIAPRCDITLYPRGITRGAASRCHVQLNLTLCTVSTRNYEPTKAGATAVRAGRRHNNMMAAGALEAAAAARKM